MIDEIVLATVPGYAPWPGRVIEINGQTVQVEFFGTGEKYNQLAHSFVSTILKKKSFLFSEISFDAMQWLDSNSIRLFRY